MESLSTLRQNSGFTLVEIVIVMAILTVVVSFGLFVSFDFYRSYAFRTEKAGIISLLQKARNQAMNNIGQTRHGVYFTDSPSQYTLFECAQPTCTAYTSGDKSLSIDTSYQLSFLSPTPTMPFSVVFDQLSGDCVTCGSGGTTLRISHSGQQYDVTINSEGRIDWQ